MLRAQVNESRFQAHNRSGDNVLQQHDQFGRGHIIEEKVHILRRMGGINFLLRVYMLSHHIIHDL